MSKAGSAITPDKRHDIDLEDGKFSRTTVQDLADAFGAFHAAKGNHICVFFHGGLVSREQGLSTAHELVKDFVASGAYPFFFIWNSDLISVIHAWLKGAADDRHYVKVVRKGVQIVAKKILAARASGQKPVSGPVPKTLRELASFAKTIDRSWAKRDGEHLGVTQGELATFQLLVDEAAASLTGPDRNRERTDAIGERYALSRIIARFNARRDHGLYTTIVEEVLLAIFTEDNIGARAWKTMKGFIDESLRPDAGVYGGTAFLKQLYKVWQPGMRLTLVGHSAGAIYVQRLLEALHHDRDAPHDLKAQVIFLAPGLSFDQMRNSLPAFKARTSNLRMFSLSDKVESGYPEVLGYDKSLLYMVSALFEADPLSDKPLVGMQRYWSGADPYTLPEIVSVSEWIPRDQRVWSLTPEDSKPGFRTRAKKHGEFPGDPLTRDSMTVMLKAVRADRVKQR